MKQNGLRAFFGSVLDVASLSLVPVRAPSIKLVFDNLRCYPLLLFFLVAVWEIGKVKTMPTTAAFFVLSVPLAFMTLVVVLQSALIAATLLAALIVSLLEESSSRRHVGHEPRMIAWMMVPITLMVMCAYYFAAFQVLATVQNMTALEGSPLRIFG